MARRITTIKILQETKERIDKLKVYHRETYDEIIQEMLSILNICKVNPEAARQRLSLIDRKKKLAKKTLPQSVQKSQTQQKRPINS